MTVDVEAPQVEHPAKVLERVSAAPRAGWNEWMRRFGRHVRRVREFLGLSQAQVAKRAGVSQGAVSRFESGRGVNTPFLAILKINVALAGELRRLEPSTLTEDVRRFLRHMEFISTPSAMSTPRPGGVEMEDIRLASHPDVERVLRLYHRLPKHRRQAFVELVRVVGEVLGA
jgi:transcriptional regulator with XRE-family HTH domain